MRFYFLYILCLTSGLGYSQDTILLCHQEEAVFSSLENANTKSIEFSPTYYGKGIVFVQAREKNRFLDPKTGRAYFDLMYTDIAPDGSASQVISFSPNIRTQYHEGPCTFNHDGTEIYFTKGRP